MAIILQPRPNEVTIQVTIPLTGTLLEIEEAIQAGVNDVGRTATVEALKRFDTDGSPLRLGEVKWTARGSYPKSYETPYGAVEVTRYVYQTSRGGRIHCPLEDKARIIHGGTPRFARQLSQKYAQMDVRSVQRDLMENHGRSIARSYIQNVADWVGTIAEAKEERWEYELPPLEAAIRTVVVSLDGTMIPMADSGGYREAMSGALSLYDAEGGRRHTIYVAAAPEYGKAEFLQRLEREVVRLKAQFPEAIYLGLADGAASNWAFLEHHTQHQLIDFFHASEYVAKIAQAAHPEHDAQAKREAWQAEHCSILKHQPGAVDTLIQEAERLTQRPKLSRIIREGLENAKTYLTNHRLQMDYASFVAQGWPIGSGVIEAACKTLIKQRLCGSGMRWKRPGAKIILSLRSLSQTRGRWSQFWQKIDQFGAEVFA